MKNKTFLVLATLTSLILPVLVNAAGFANDKINHEGALNISGKAPIRLEMQAGKSILLNNGMMEMRSEKIKMGFSILDPKLIIKQNGEILSISIPSDSYHNDEEFTLLKKDSDLNYDLYLRKTETTRKSVDKIDIQSCHSLGFTYKCGIIVKSATYNCGSYEYKRVKGKQKVKETYADISEIYKLTLAIDSKVKAEFTSQAIRSELINSQELEVCKI